MAEKHQTMTEKQIRERERELEFDTDRLGAGSLMTQQSHTNASRLIMTNHQLSHMNNIKNPEAPKVLSGFENSLSKVSSMLVQTDTTYRIVAKLPKNKYRYILIAFDEVNQVYHAWERTEAKELSEGFATQWNNEYIDSLEVGDEVPEKTFIQKSTSYDKYMNYQYGKNLNTVYLAIPDVHEDGILAMNGVENMMSIIKLNTYTIKLDDTEVFLNLYGDDENFVGLPEIGEKIKNGIICGIRRITNDKAPYSLKGKRLQRAERGDRQYYAEGRVIDYDILYNKDLSDLPDVGATKQIRRMYIEQQEYYRKVYKYMYDIVDNAEVGGYTCTTEFSMILANVRKFVDSTVYFVDNNDSVFGNMQIICKVLDEDKLKVGSKLVGRFGNKGVISKILPPEESWFMEDGRPIHLVVSSLGIVGRVNQSQMNEHSINELSATAVDMMKQKDDPMEKLKIMLTLLYVLNKKEARAFRKYAKGLSKEKLAKLMKRVEREGITVIQEPIENANILDIEKAYELFPANWQRIVFPDGNKSLRKVLNAKMFNMRLKQDPLEKYSVRSRGPVNPITSTPARSAQKKRGLAPASDVAVRIGEYEIEILLGMVNHPAAIADFMAENSTSWNAKVHMAEQISLNEPDNEIDMTGVKLNGRKNMELISSYLNVMGTKIEMEVEEAPEGEWFTD